MFRKKKDGDGEAEEPSILSRWSSEHPGEAIPPEIQAQAQQEAAQQQSSWLDETAAAPAQGNDPSQWAPPPMPAEQPQPVAEQPQYQEQPQPVAEQPQYQEQPQPVAEQPAPTQAQVISEPPKMTGGPPDLANYDPNADSYNQNKIPGAQAREEYSKSLVPPGGDISDEYRWHTGRIRPTGRPDAVEFVEVHKAFGRNKILRGLNMGIPEGQISMILGPSGTGKSVCIKHMVGLLYPDDGDVLVHGESVPNMVDDRLFEVRKKFGVLFQDGALFGSMNLFDNVCFPLRQHTDKGEDEVEEIVMKRLREVGLEQAIDKFPNELSGGMRKRAGFARALVLDPDIVLFDEPDSGLDPVRTALLCELIQEVHEENGGAYVVITHDIMSAKRVAEHISVLWKGRIVESGPAEELFNSDNMFVRQFLSGASRGPLGME
jgi:phospholipid/cholesterol/gamma-HCH transport system ATP-binding protein